MTHFLFTVVIFLLALGILVVVHEWGHYIMAKLSGIWVEKFSIGFGPKIIGFKKGDTDFRVAPIFLGGYVKLYGQDPYEEAGRDPVAAAKIANDPRSFASKSYFKRLGVVLGGPVINFVLCLLLLPLAFWIGKKELRFENEKPIVIGVEPGSVAEKIGVQVGDEILAFNGEAAKTWKDLIFTTSSRPGQKGILTFRHENAVVEKEIVLDVRHENGVDFGILGVEPHPFLMDKPIVGAVSPGSAAETAGLQPGDVIRKINGSAILHWTQMLDILKGNDETQAERVLDLQIERSGQLVNVTATAQYDAGAKRWLLGITKLIPEELYGTQRHSFGESLRLTLPEFWTMGGRLFEFLGGLFSGEISAKHLGGPIQIASEASNAASRGLGDFIYLLAFLSLQLGILNLVPIPVLDGGQAVLMTFEAVIRRPIPHKIRAGILYLGVFAVLGILLLVTFNDLNRALGFAKLWQSFTNLF